MGKKRDDLLWQDRQRNFLGLPWTFKVYKVNKDRLFIDTGFLNSREDEVRLYRITDITLTRSLWQKIIGCGTLHVDSADPTMKNFDIKNVKNIYDVKEQLSQLVEESRRANRVYTRESINVDGGPGDPCGPGEDGEMYHNGPDFDADDDDRDNH